MFCDGCIAVINDDEAHYECTMANCLKNYCALCANIKSSKVDAKTWKCPACSTKERKAGDNSSTPIRSQYHTLNVTTRKKTNSASSTGSVTAPTMAKESEVSELTAEVRRLTYEIISLTDRLEEATTSLSSCHVRLDELSTRAANVDVQIKNNEIKLNASEQKVAVLEANVSHLQFELNTQAQNNLKNEVEIAGIPETENENLMHTVLVAARKIGVELSDQDIDWVNRVGPRRPKGTKLPERAEGPLLPRPIVMRLLRRTKRDNIIKASKTRRNLTSQDLEVDGPSSRVFFNERLTKENRQLFREARSKSKQHGFAYCWCSQGSIYLRQREGKPAQQVRTQQDMVRIFPVISNASTS